MYLYCCHPFSPHNYLHVPQLPLKFMIYFYLVIIVTYTLHICIMYKYDLRSPSGVAHRCV